ncbi:MAG: hypothetical protein MUF25_18350, partial [Pirellulaceae bacterium]|nr:hypothetical protein [Pirellulaceae bacterium]
QVTRLAQSGAQELQAGADPCNAGEVVGSWWRPSKRESRIAGQPLPRTRSVLFHAARRASTGTGQGLYPADNFLPVALQKAAAN